MSVPYYGDFAEDDTINIPFNTFSSDDPSASITVTDLVDTDVYVFKDGSTTEYGADAAVAVTLNFDGNTGAHMCTIDLSENAYFATGSEYAVMLIGITVDGATLNVWIGSFSIERAGGTLATVKLIQAAVITNAAGADIAADIIAVKAETVNILTDTGTTLENRLIAIEADTDVIDDGTSGLVKIASDVASILTDTGTTLDTLIKDIPTTAEFEARSIVSADYVVVGDTIAAVTLVNGLAANVITAASINANAITEAKIADNAIAGEHLNATACTKIIDDFETQSQADPTGFHVNLIEINGQATQLEMLMDLTTGVAADGDLTAKVVDASVLSHIMTAGADTSDYQASTDALEVGSPSAATISAQIATDMQADPTDYHVNVMEVNGTGQTANDNGADINAILTDTNELQVDWVNGGRLDNLLDGAASAGDPWTTALPGAYGAGTAGKIVGDNVNAPIATIDTVVDAILVDTADMQPRVVAIEADTNELQVDDYPTSIAAIQTTVDAIETIVDTNAAGADIAADIIALKAETALIVADTNELQTDDYPTSIAAIQTTVDAIETIVDTNAAGADIAADIIALKAETALIVADTNELQTDDYPTSIAAIQTTVDAIETIVDTNAAGADIAADIIALKAETALIVADTNELQTDDYPTSIAAIKSETALIVADTNELQTDDIPGKIVTLDAVVDTVKVDTAAIKVVTDALTAAAAAKLATSAGTIVVGTVSHDNTAASTTVFYCDDITEATADHFNGRIVIFTSGALQYQATDISDYELVAGEGKFTVTALTEAPADNVTFIII